MSIATGPWTGDGGWMNGCAGQEPREPPPPMTRASDELPNDGRLVWADYPDQRQLVLAFRFGATWHSVSGPDFAGPPTEWRYDKDDTPRPKPIRFASNDDRVPDWYKAPGPAPARLPVPDPTPTTAPARREDVYFATGWRQYQRQLIPINVQETLTRLAKLNGGQVPRVLDREPLTVEFANQCASKLVDLDLDDNHMPLPDHVPTRRWVRAAYLEFLAWCKKVGWLADEPETPPAGSVESSVSRPAVPTETTTPATVSSPTKTPAPARRRAAKESVV